MQDFHDSIATTSVLSYQDAEMNLEENIIMERLEARKNKSLRNVSK